MEGPEALLASLGLDVEIPDRQETAVDEPLPEMAASQSLAALVRRLGTAYRDGRISSGQATDLLGRLVLVTRHGDVWTMGVSSKGWYAFEDGQWTPRDTLPDDEELLTRSELVAWSLDEEDETAKGAVGEDVGEALAAFLFGAAGTLPEPITPSWEPPSEAPPVWPRCPACGRENLPGYRLCAWCGAAAPPPVQEEASWMRRDEPVGAPAEPAGASGILLTCPACGAARRLEQAFCEECGARLSQVEPVTPPPSPPEARLCQKCGAQVGPGDRFCGNCGAPLG